AIWPRTETENHLKQFRRFSVRADRMLAETRAGNRSSSTHHAHGLNRAIVLPACTDPYALTLATLRPHQVGCANGDESHTDTSESHLLAQQCSDEERASCGDEEIAGAVQVGATWHSSLLVDGLRVSNDTPCSAAMYTCPATPAREGELGSGTRHRCDTSKSDLSPTANHK